MSLSCVLGIDPGIRGGLAIITRHEIDAIDIPVNGVGAKARVDAVQVYRWLIIAQHGRNEIDHAFIERAGVMPKQHPHSGFLYGRAVGALEACVLIAGIPLTIIEPSVWKRSMGLLRSDKEASRQKALQLFPNASALFARKKDHGRAEATLIARYGWQTTAIR